MNNSIRPALNRREVNLLILAETSRWHAHEIIRTDPRAYRALYLKGIIREVYNRWGNTVVRAYREG